jgi:glycosyltransferase involved in cell wall biosynthesis
MSKIRILAIPPDMHGVGKFRILAPYTYLQENYPDDFHIDINPNVEDDDKSFDGYDIVVVHTFVHQKSTPEQNQARVNWLRSQNIIVIVDFDDYWEPDMRHPMFAQVKMSGIVEVKKNLIRSADYVTVTTPIYRDTMRKTFKLDNVHVFPNAVDGNEPQFQSNLIPSDKTRFGWLGGSSHLYDIELLRQGLGLTYNKYGEKVQFVLCGFDLRGTITEINKDTGEKSQRPIKPEETVWTKYEKIFTNNYTNLDDDYTKFLLTFKEAPYTDSNKPYVRRWTKKITEYATNYNYFDVSLAPLVPSVFNGNKSQLKAIESGFFKKALIASETDPYTVDLVSATEKGGGFNPKGNALLVDPVKNHKQWGKHMKLLMDNPNLIEDLGEKLHETVKDKYSLKKVCEDRAQFLKSIVK